ncbi:MAG: hypothetical protein NTW30_01990 [Candidatus Aenigmarchaeota archaeon]|nr:hypothetical protein [Candidatus Aenigmarchaeota archaeon]
MIIKEILKPDWKKLILCILLPSIPSFIASFINAIQIAFIFRPFYMTVLFSTGILNLRTFVDYMLAGVATILDLIYIYLLSCLIVWVYDKVKKKKE